MSKSSLKLHSLFAGLALALFLSGCDLIEPAVAQGLAPASAAAEATYAQPDHP
ncbi:MAG: hypothetical protein OEW90_06905 [Betaproteobacteria bacterium]|nr:hypothetical protein [Betaproteobacteria bacterium]MDH4323855.1 hypothetical protein [Betaproteobacteria bacterium]